MYRLIYSRWPHLPRERLRYLVVIRHAQIYTLTILQMSTFISGKSNYTGIYNAGFENISILDIAKMVATQVEADIEVTESNDPRSYRVNSDKLLGTG